MNGQPLHIHVDIMVFEVSKIDDISLSLTFELYFDLMWKETRLIINDREAPRLRVTYEFPRYTTECWIGLLKVFVAIGFSHNWRTCLEDNVDFQPNK